MRGHRFLGSGVALATVVALAGCGDSGARAEGDGGPGSCGNGTVESGEQCDQGAANGTSGNCCSASCQYVTADTMCRATAGPCDVAEVCSGSSATCPDDTLAAAGAAGSPSCAPYVCNGSLAGCPTSCSSNADCSSGNSCQGNVCAGSGGVPVWPGTSTRYYPGIYPHAPQRGAATVTGTAIETTFDSWFGGVEDDYREFVGATPVTHLGVTIYVDPSLFFTDYWQSSTQSPYNWQCDRIPEAASPDAAPGNPPTPLYNWALFDDILDNSAFVQNGGRVIIRIMQTYTGGTNDRTPAWMRTAPGGTQGNYVVPNKWGSYDTQMQDWAAVRMWQDVMAAFATRYKGDSRIAAFLIDETYPSAYTNQQICPTGTGLVDGLAASKASQVGMLEVAKAYLDVDPGMLWSFVNWHPGQTPQVDTWEKGYLLADNVSRSLGADALPGVQGHHVQDPHFFNWVGAGSPSGSTCIFDAEDNPGMNHYLAQYYGVNRTAPVFMGSESNGWYLGNTNRRINAMNPWNVAWPAAGSSLPNDDGDVFPSARFWVWYASGAPRADTPADDSGLGQGGPDPCGVMPSSFYLPNVPTWSSGKPGWTDTNLSIAHWLRAFDTFGPRGTKAMFSHPDGYLEQFQ